jgi:hypothetical protein
MMTSRWQICWPPVSDQRDIQVTVRMGCIAAGFFVFKAGLLVLFGPFIILFETRNLVDAQALLQPLAILLIALSIGWGIYKKKRVATVAGLALMLSGLILSLASHGIKGKDTLLYFLSSFMFLHATRGIFSYHKLFGKNEK